MVILTGAPGCGKTSIIRELAKRGFSTVDEAATDIITQKQSSGITKPWLEPNFIENVVALQLTRMKAQKLSKLVFHDRSLICTLALCRYLDITPPKALMNAIKRLKKCPVFYVESLETIENNAVRTINLDEAKRFGQMHIEAYQSFGFIPLSFHNAGF